MKKLGCLLMALVICLSLAPQGALAESDALQEEIFTEEETFTAEGPAADEEEPPVDEELPADEEPPDEEETFGDEVIPAGEELPADEVTPAAEEETPAEEERSAAEDEPLPLPEADADAESELDPSSFPVLSLDTDTPVHHEPEGGFTWFRFVPEKTERYRLVTLTGYPSVSAVVYDEDMKQLTYAFEGGSAGRLRLDASLLAGHTYYYAMRLSYPSQDSDFTIRLSVCHRYENGECVYCGTGLSLSGGCGEGLTWTLSGGVLTVSGAGEMLEPAEEWTEYKSEIEAVVIEDGVTSVMQDSFAGCAGLRTVSLGNTVREIGAHAFSSCPLLESVTLPDSVETVGYYAFRNCGRLTELELGAGLRTVDGYAFSDCGFTSLVIPASVETIGYGAFSSVHDLEELIFLGDAPEMTLTSQWLRSTQLYYPADAAGWDELKAGSEFADRMIPYADAADLLLRLRTIAPGGFSAGNTYALPEGFIEYWWTSTPMWMYVTKAQDAVYIFNQRRLERLSLETGLSQRAYTFSYYETNNAYWYEANGVLYVLENDTVVSYDMETGAVKYTPLYVGLNSVSALGVDGQGRIYIAESYPRYTIKLLSPDGALLSSCESGSEVRCFDGFDDTNGRFYMQQTVSGGCVTSGMVRGDEISMEENSVTYSTDFGGMISYQSCAGIEYVGTTGMHDAELFGGYLITSSRERMWTLGFRSDTKQSFWQMLRYDDENMYALGMSTSSNYFSVGVRGAYFPERNSILIYRDTGRLAEHDAESLRTRAEYTPSHPVFMVKAAGDLVVILEREDDAFYLELVDWTEPEEPTVEGESQMKVGQTQLLSLISTQGYDLGARWFSSDKSVVTVTEEGRVAAWGEGTAEISISVMDGKYFLTFPITVQGSVTDADDALSAVQGGGAVSRNISREDYTVWSTVVRSYLAEEDDGTLTRVEYTDDGALIVESLSRDGAVLQSRSVEQELPLFGGFYSGEAYNFLVFGQKNDEENDDAEVVRVVKYDKDWQRLDSMSLRGANTVVPFSSGSLRMTETDGALYIHTCHTMYADGNGVNHQANMTLAVDQESMALLDGAWQVSNATTGYVSHSFAQFVRADGGYLYRVDHGDSVPRAVGISRCDPDIGLSRTWSAKAPSIPGKYGDNATGVSVGGFEIGSEKLLIAGNAVDLNSTRYDPNGQRNIFLSLMRKDLLASYTVQLTKYTEGSGVRPGTPQLVKLSGEHFLVLWEERDASGSYLVRMAEVDQEGTVTRRGVSHRLRLSDCQPIVTSDGLVRWYVTDGSTLTMYALDPFTLGELGGTDGPDPWRAAQVLMYLVGSDSGTDPAADDADGSGDIGANDAALLLR